jgi:uncharacterized protein YfaS (alpha-2-macroglobulin family)
MRAWVRLVLALLVLSPLGAAASNAPQVVMATPGTGGGSIERFTVRFSDPMVALGDPRATGPFKVECSTAGQGRWIDQRTYVWEFTAPLPGGQSCSFDLRAGLTDLRGAELAGTRRFTVDSGGPKARAVLPGDGTIEEDQVFLVAANQAPDLRSVAANAYCAVDGIGEKIPVDVLKPEVATKVVEGLGPDDYRLSSFLEEGGLPQALPKDAAGKARALASVVPIKCRRPLPSGRDVALVWGAGISAGGRTAGADQRFDYTVRDAFTAKFECSRVNPRAGCSPVEDARVRFTAAISRTMAEKIRIQLPDGKLLVPFWKKDEHRQAVEDITFKAPLPALTDAKVLLPPDVRDESGRPLANAQRFPLPVRFDEAPPLVKFAANFGILEAQEGGVLPVTVRNVEPALQGRSLAVQGETLRVEGSDGEIANWLRAIDKHEKNDFREEKRRGEQVTVNFTGAEPLLKRVQGASVTVPLPSKGKMFEVVGVPLKRPGFYVIELASPGLGRALLGRNAPRYVTAGALVTNMSVHFKWGRGASLAWVTALDSGKPVARADVRVTDSCTGQQLARGTTDAQGRLLIKSGLPEPETYGDCSENSTAHPLMISARAGDDFSFTLTDWGEGIRPYDFDLPYGWSESGDILHTVFDRTLIRAGETVNMKHILRKPVAEGFAYGAALNGTLKLVHRGSDTEFTLPLTIDKSGIGETSWTAPQGAPQGDYELSVLVGDKTIYTGQSVRVDEFRLPTMRASVSGPKQAAIRPRQLPVDLFVGYLSGGGASNMPVRVRTAFEEDESAPDGWEGWSFGGKALTEGITPLDGDGEEIAPPLPPGTTVPITLGAEGTGRTTIDIPAAIDSLTRLTVEMDYEDANGETLTASTRIPLYPSAVRLGLKIDGWLMKQDDMRLQFVALDTDGHPLKGQRIRVELYSREVLTARRRLIGGFYAYDNQARVKKLDASCTARTDELGLARCTLDPGVSGEVYAVATTEDDQGNVARAVRSVWLAGDDDWWFGGDNGDRMDLVPEQKEYASGSTARLQVRMPFRSATALVTIEREGVLSSFVTTLSGKDPVVEVPMPAAYAPDVYVSVLAVRGRVSGWKLWFADLARRWNLPFFSRDGASPTALVDLAKPSYRLGIAKLKVGWEGHRLAVAVKTDRPRYSIRQTAMTDVTVKRPDGKPTASAEIAFAAVDEALLQLAPNESWNVLDRMMTERPISVLTSTAQTQVVGKRHYGKKTAEPGGGGGGDLSGLTREDFRPVLLWRGRVRLDAQGHARLPVPLADSLSAYKLVAIATDGPALFGTGETSIRTTQDLTIYAGLPPLVRGGDHYAASFTLRNGTGRPMTVVATARINPEVAKGHPIRVTIPANGAAPIAWLLDAPGGSGTLKWTVDVRQENGPAKDSIAVEQQVEPLVPTEVWAATIARIGEATQIPVAAPAGALPGRGSVDVRLSTSLAPPLDGVRAYMAAYPYGCFEQRLSKAVALGDSGAWNALAGELPAYLDRDGLVRYFPDERMDGSEALTAYALSVTAEAGLAVPDAPKARMLEAMRAVVDGRLKRESIGGGDQRLLRVAALAALARNGAADARMLGGIGLAPADMPTIALADWLAILDKTPGANPALRAQAENVLRQRIVFEGSRLDLVDQGRTPWWMMTSGDEMTVRALLAVLGRPGWQEDAPKLMIGVAARQQRGHWDTTLANAWGTLAVRRFQSLYPESAIAGTTVARLGPATLSRSWPLAPDNRLLRFALPAQRSMLLLGQQGGAGPWANVSIVAAVPLRQPLFAGYRLTKDTQVVERKRADRLSRGDVVRVRLTVEASADRNWVVVSDPVPPGATIVSGLGGQSALLNQSSNDTGEPSYVERGRDGWRGYFAWLPRGRTVVEYTVRLNGVGRFNLPPSRVEAMYSPDIRAAVPNGPVDVGFR